MGQMFFLLTANPTDIIEDVKLDLRYMWDWKAF
jgi:hypothetical protein